jgi:hypothetical protein
MPNAVVRDSVYEALYELSKNIVPLEPSKFSPLGCYSEPLRSTRQVRLGRENLVKGDGIISLKLPHQILFLSLLYPEYGPLEHGSLRRQLDAVYSPEGQAYIDTVLAKFWVYTGEMGSKSYNTHEFGRVVKVESIGPTVVFEGETPHQPTSGEYRFILSRKGVYVPSEVGPFRHIEDVTGNGYWNGVHSDTQGRSAVRCYWNSNERGLHADATGPLVRTEPIALGVWRKLV